MNRTFRLLVLALCLPGDERGELDDDDEPSFRETLRIFMDPRLTPIYGIIVIKSRSRRGRPR